MNILIIEDEAIASERMQQLVKVHVTDGVIVGVCDSVEESIKFLQQQQMPDLILMDIELSDGQSFDIFEEVEVTSPVIFTTAYDEFMLKAFSVHSIDYILKPVQAEDLQRSIAKFRQLKKVYNAMPAFTANELLTELRKSITPSLQTPREHFLVKQGHRLISIHASEIAYFYSEEKLTFLQASNGKQYMMDQPLEELEKQVDPKRFFRCSRKHLVERKSISNVIIHFNGKLKLEIKPIPKDDVLVNRDRAPEFKKWLGA